MHSSNMGLSKYCDYAMLNATSLQDVAKESLFGQLVGCLVYAFVTMSSLIWDKYCTATSKRQVLTK